MSFFSRWIRKRRELLVEARAQAERQTQRKQRDLDQTQALRLTLHELQRTMDPLMAAQAYNNRFCPLSRLPEEILLSVLDFLADDVVSLWCLRMVSTVFLRLLHPRAVIWNVSRCYSQSREYLRLEYDFPHSLCFPCAVLETYYQRLRRDGRCGNCRRWNDAGIRPVGMCKFQQYYYYSTGLKPDAMLYCDACGHSHNVGRFSAGNQLTREHRWCLGQEGSVQLCKHVKITWASIKAHIDNWRRGRGDDWQACLDSFKIECRHASHDSRCAASEAPTWPQARLRLDRLGGTRVFLDLTWTPHSRIDALALAANGQIPAPELRALFQRLRQLGPANTLYPPGRPEAPPEMAYFSPQSQMGSFVYYNTGEGDNIPPPTPSFLLQPDRWPFKLTRLHSGSSEAHLRIRFHEPSGACGTGISRHCLVVKYQRLVRICTTPDMTDRTVNIEPSVGWLHAMDPRTYPDSHPRQRRPPCSDETCVNNHQRPTNC